ncbi:MAG: protein kinase [bacterium]
MKVCQNCSGCAIGQPLKCAECGSSLAESPSVSGDELSGSVIERKYRLLECIGEGAMGWVYRGVHLALDSSVAVKLMKPSQDQSDINDKRFAREARAASRLNNPHIISITDFGRTPGGVLFIVSEYLRGVTLTDLLEKHGPLPIPRTLQIADQLLSGLEEAHSAKLVHRDLKPDNLMITPLRSGEDFVKILDFGIAKLGGGGAARLTHQGEVIGTPTYMSPEQIRGKEVVAQTDLYACGAMLYEMLSGRPPFDSESVMEVLGLHLSAEPVPLREAAPERDIPEALDAAILRALSKQASDRFASAAEFRQALTNVATVEAAIKQECPVCGHPRSGYAKFCEECGSPLRGESALKIPTASYPRPHEVKPTADTLYAKSPPTEAVEAAEKTREDRVQLEQAAVQDTLNRRLRAEQTFQFSLLGRERETEQLESFLESDAQLAEIIAPEGTGRSRLLREAGVLALRLGINPIWVTPDPTLARTPWYTVRKLVATILELDEEPTLESIRQRISSHHLAPGDSRGLLELFGLGAPEGYVEHAVRVRETRTAALRSLFHSNTGPVTMCILIDDADELDGASAAFFQDLAGLVERSALKLIFAGESSIMTPEQVQLRLEPKPFDEAQVVALMDSVPRKRESWPGLAQTIHKLSNGNPLWVTQAIRLLVEGGTEVEASLADIVTTRVNRLPAEAMKVLQVVSVVGLAARMEQVRTLAGLDEGRLRSAVKLLVRRQLLLNKPSQTLTVVHSLIARSVRELMPADVRQSIHRQILEDLISRGALPIALARHAAAAALGDRAVELLREAGRAAETMLDDVGAANHYRHALQIARWQMLLEESDPICLDLALRLGDSLRYCGDFVAADMVLKEAVLTAVDEPAWHARLLHSLALLELAQGNHSTAVETMQYAVRQAFFSAKPALLNQMYIDLGRVLDQAGQALRAAAELEEGVLVVTSGDGPAAEAAPDSFWRLLAQLAELQFRQGSASNALSSAQAALRQAEAHGSQIGQARCHYRLARCYDRLERPEEADEHHVTALAAFQLLGDRRSAVEVLLSRASTSATGRGELTRMALDLSQQIAWEPGIRAATALSADGPS